jgi:FkbM family methyltransferase
MHPITTRDRWKLLKYNARHSTLPMLRRFLRQPKEAAWSAWYNRLPITVRPGTTDIHVFQKVFIDREYDFSMCGEVKVILDGGANTGLSAIFLSVKYPTARIIAVEPELSNYRVMLENVQPYPNITPVLGAFGEKSGGFRIRNKGGDQWNFMVEPSQDDGQDGRYWTVDDLCLHYGIESIDYFKIDIEGGESALFSANTSWLSRTRYLSIELHDAILPSSSNSFLKAIGAHTPFTFTTVGENHLLHFLRPDASN